MKKKKGKKIIIAILLIGIFAIGVLAGNILARTNIANSNNEENAITQIVEVTVGKQTIENTLTSSGEINESQTEELSLSTSKYFKVMCVEEDDLVEEGENILQYTNGTYLVAPYDCRIESISVPETGSKCSSSNYIKIQNIETMTMTLQISETEINQVQKGQEVEITLNAIEDKTYTGTIQSISSVGNYNSSGTTFEAIVSFENDGNAKIGMSASCNIILTKAEDVVAVPIEAVQTKDGKKYVVCVKEDDQVENIFIETGISNDSYVEVTSGLTGGETIQMTQTISNTATNGFMNRRSGTDENSGRPTGGMPEGTSGTERTRPSEGDMQAIPSGN